MSPMAERDQGLNLNLSNTKLGLLLFLVSDTLDASDDVLEVDDEVWMRFEIRGENFVVYIVEPVDAYSSQESLRTRGQPVVA